MADDFLPIPHIPQPHSLPSTPSPSGTFTDQWATLAVGAPVPLTPRAIGHWNPTGSSEMDMLKLKVSQLEVALEELKCRVDVSNGESSVSTEGVIVDHPLLQVRTQFLAR